MTASFPTLNCLQFTISFMSVTPSVERTPLNNFSIQKRRGSNLGWSIS